jgi:hypothetical protein
MIPADTILAVIRGDLPLASLESVGVHMVIRENTYEEHIEVPVEVMPSASDIVQGLLTYRNQANELRRWALFIMGSEVVSFEELHGDPQGEQLIEAIWDASFGHSFDNQVFKQIDS